MTGSAPRWKPPPLIKPIRRCGWGLIAASVYLVLATGSIEVNWDPRL
jgi:hypothetical protein